MSQSWWLYFTWTLLYMSLRLTCNLSTEQKTACDMLDIVLSKSFQCWWILSQTTCQKIWYWKAVEELISGFNSPVCWPILRHHFKTKTERDQDLYLEVSSPLSFKRVCIFGDTSGTTASSTFCSPTCKYWSKRHAWEINYSIQTLVHVKKA